MTRRNLLHHFLVTTTSCPNNINLILSLCRSARSRVEIPSSIYAFLEAGTHFLLIKYGRGEYKFAQSYISLILEDIFLERLPRSVIFDSSGLKLTLLGSRFPKDSLLSNRIWNSILILSDLKSYPHWAKSGSRS